MFWKRPNFDKKSTLKWLQSSSFTKRWFCFNCGGSVFYKLIKGDHISVSAGMIYYLIKLKTNLNIFIKGKLDYYSTNKRLKILHRFSKKTPGDGTGLIYASEIPNTLTTGLYAIRRTKIMSSHLV